ncbi:WbqC family protein [Pedobacter sp. SYP-B3415]|uniref:WbqC family protein n=1 Tax=Pedobacter sp. SYP-B3415 TaxID=2496641 RepID=UPI00101CBFE7|nr:WbqC family protein [Pedobacter sp. SYP-B3415]
MQNTAIFPLFYLPSVDYFRLLANHDGAVVLEQHEHFPKQTYRNRASIYSPNGRLDLTVPVVKGSKVHTKVKDVKISYDFDWRRLQRLSLESCYRNSAYFEYYEDELMTFFDKKPVFLFDLNLELTTWLLRKLKLDVPFSLSAAYEHANDGQDFRSSIHPKKESPLAPGESYYQVFGERHGFIPNLSIIDLLFSKGPQSKAYLGR